jgi:hypothetical protein
VEVAVFTLLIMFGTTAAASFPPLLVLYALGCVAWFVYWFSTNEPKE